MVERGWLLQGDEPFGSLLPGRNYSSGSYNFGFQGQEKDDEVYGVTGASYAFTYRMYDARIGRFQSIDPLTAKYPYWTPYAFSGNRVIDKVEFEGLEPADPPTSDGEIQDAGLQGQENSGNMSWLGLDGAWTRTPGNGTVEVRPSENQNNSSGILGKSGGFSMTSEFGEGSADRKGSADGNSWDVSAFHVLAGKEGLGPEGSFFEKIAEGFSRLFEAGDEAKVLPKGAEGPERSMEPRRMHAESMDKPALHQPTDDSIRILYDSTYIKSDGQGGWYGGGGPRETDGVESDTAGQVLKGNKHFPILKVTPK